MGRSGTQGAGDKGQASFLEPTVGRYPDEGVPPHVAAYLWSQGVVGVDGCSVAWQGWSPGLAGEGRRGRRGTNRTTLTVDRRPGPGCRGWTVLRALADLRT